MHKDVGLDGWLTVFESEYAVFQSGRRHGVFHVHDCRDYEYSTPHGKQMEPKPTIKFYVVKCAKCPPCGIFYTCATLEEALVLYDDLPDGRINGTRGLDFEIEQDSTIDGMVDNFAG